MKKKRTTLLFKRQFANMIESYAAIVSLPTNDIKEYAKAAIRDIFIQMPSRSVTYENWRGYKQYVVGFFGEDSYNIAMEELQRSGWLIESETRYEWKKMYGPVMQNYENRQLKEWADTINIISNDGKKKKISYLNEDAYAFEYDMDDNMVYLSNAKGIHGYETNTDSISMAGHKHIRGRVWTEKKILSLWTYPKSKSKFESLIEAVNIALKEKNLPEINYLWKFDIPITEVDLYSNNIFAKLNSEHYDDQTYNDFRDITSVLIPISQWTPEAIKNPIQYLTRNSNLKSKRYNLPPEYVDKVGKGYNLSDIPSFVKHGIEVTSDSTMKLKPMIEWADRIIIPHASGEQIYRYNEMDAHAFGYNEYNKMKVGNPGLTHAASNISPYNEAITGRIWTKDKIISFWKYPNSLLELKKIIKDINDFISSNEKKIKYDGDLINSSWKIDIPKIKYNIQNLNVLKNQEIINRNEHLHSIYAINSLLIPIFDYNPDMISKAEDFQQMVNDKLHAHIMSPLEKAKKGIKIKTPGFGAEKRYKVDNPSKLGGAYKQGDVPQHVAHQMKYTSDSIIKSKSIIENKSNDEYKKYIPKLTRFMIENGMKLQPLPKVKIRNSEVKNAESIFGKTAHYDRDLKEITLFTLDRHPKDILRSFAHEMVHHEQNLNGRLNNINSINTNEDGEMEKFEKEAYEKGNIMLRNWEDSIKQNISEQKLNEIQTEYGCLMLKVNFPNWDKFVNTYIKAEDIYDNVAHEYGREYEAHITILYGFHEDVNTEKIKKIIQSLKNEITVTTDKINTFNNNKFDVVKFEIKSAMLTKLNEIMQQNFKYTSSHPKYNAHMTIAYVKPGVGQKYAKNLNKILSFTSGTFIYSYPGGKKEEFSIKKLNKI